MENYFYYNKIILHALIGGVLLSSGGQKKPISHDFVRSREEPKVLKEKRLHNLLKPNGKKNNEKKLTIIRSKSSNQNYNHSIY